MSNILKGGNVDVHLMAHFFFGGGEETVVGGGWVTRMLGIS